jgi:signal transduction histidine kinase
VTEQLPSLPAAVEVATFRIVTEAVTNVVRHAEATTCRIELTAEHRLLRIVVADDGRGVSVTDDARVGHGLQTMRERAEELRGRLRVLTGDGSGHVGTTVLAELPLPSQQPQQMAPRERAVAR